MDERKTTQGAGNIRTVLRYVAEIVILSLGISTLSVGATGLSAPHVKQGGSAGVVGCSTPMQIDEQWLAPPPHDPTLPFHPY